MLFDNIVKRPVYTAPRKTRGVERRCVKHADYRRKVPQRNDVTKHFENRLRFNAVIVTKVWRVFWDTV